MTDEHKAAQATPQELCESTLRHYDELSTKACHWNNQIPQAIRFWYLEKPDLLAELSRAHEEFKAIQALHGIDLSEAISKTGAALARAKGA